MNDIVTNYDIFKTADRIVMGRYPWLERFTEIFSIELSNEFKMDINAISFDCSSIRNLVRNTSNDEIIYHCKQYSDFFTSNFLIFVDEPFLIDSSLNFDNFFSKTIINTFRATLCKYIDSDILFEYINSYRTKLNNKNTILRNISKYLYCGHAQEFICILFEFEKNENCIGRVKILFPIQFLYELTKMGVNLKNVNIEKKYFAKNDLSKIFIDCEIRTESVKGSISDLLKLKVGDVVLFGKKKRVYINDKELIYD